MNILVLFLILGKTIQCLTIRYTVSCGFFIDALYQGALEEERQKGSNGKIDIGGSHIDDLGPFFFGQRPKERV